MKTVALHSFAANFARQRNQFGDGRLAAMKTRIEAGNLRHMRQTFKNRFDGCQVIRLM